MTLLRIDRHMKEQLLNGVPLEDLYLDFGADGVECEVKGCEVRSEHFLEANDDEGSNLCTVHYNLITSWQDPNCWTAGIYHKAIPLNYHKAIPLKVNWDDDTSTIFHVKV